MIAALRMIAPACMISGRSGAGSVAVVDGAQGVELLGEPLVAAVDQLDAVHLRLPSAARAAMR